MQARHHEMKGVISLLDLHEVQFAARQWLREWHKAPGVIDPLTVRRAILGSPRSLRQGGKVHLSGLYEYLSATLDAATVKH